MLTGTDYYFFCSFFNVTSFEHVKNNKDYTADNKTIEIAKMRNERKKKLNFRARNYSNYVV